MRYGIISDIHSNLEAFQEVLSALQGKVDQLVCLGDIVGYNPNPNECCELIIKNNIACVAGNHDWAVSKNTDITFFNPEAQSIVLWTKAVISPEHTEFMKNLSPRLEFDNFEAVHGTLRNPIDEYLITWEATAATFDLMKKPLCFVGHTHRSAFLFSKGENFRGFLIKGEGVFPLKGIEKVVFNVGAVGQPRDGDPRACYTIYDADTNEISIFRIPYDVEAVQNKMRKAGFPQALIDRLRIGL